MVPKPTVCTGFTLMRKNHFKFCVTLQLTAEAGPPFRGAWMALLTFMSTGNHTKKASEIWRAGFGSGMTTFTVSLHLPTCCSALIWKIKRVTDDLPSIPQATHWYLRVSPSSMWWAFLYQLFALRILGYLSGKFRNFFHLGSSIELA